MSIIFSATIANAVGRLCQQAAKAGTKEANSDWLFVLPLYHFMDGISEPFMTPKYDPETILFYTRFSEFEWRLPQGLVLTLKENVCTLQKNFLYHSGVLMIYTWT